MIVAICRDAYRPTVQARLSPDEARDNNAASRDSADNVSQAEYTGPARCSGLSLSLGCCGICGTHDEEVGQDEGGERSDHLALIAESTVSMPVEVNDNDNDKDQAVANTVASPPAEVKEGDGGDDRAIITADVSTPIETGGCDDDESRSVATVDTTFTGWRDGVGWGNAGTGAWGNAGTGGWGGTSTALSDFSELRASWTGTRWDGPATRPTGWDEPL